MANLAPLRLALAAVLLAATACAALAQAAPAQTPAKPKKQCVYERDINGWNEVDDRTVILSARVRDRYLVKLFSPCPEVRQAQVIGFRNRGSDWVCTGDTFDLYVREPGMSVPRICPAVSMTPITREEATALSSKKRKR
jgi:hypothetical protein